MGEYSFGSRLCAIWGSPSGSDNNENRHNSSILWVLLLQREEEDERFTAEAWMTPLKRPRAFQHPPPLEIQVQRVQDGFNAPSFLPSCGMLLQQQQLSRLPYVLHPPPDTSPGNNRVESGGGAVAPCTTTAAAKKTGQMAPNQHTMGLLLLLLLRQQQ